MSLSTTPTIMAHDSLTIETFSMQVSTSSVFQIEIPVQAIKEGHAYSFRYLHKCLRPVLESEIKTFCDPDNLGVVIECAFLDCWLHARSISNHDYLVGVLYTSIFKFIDDINQHAESFERMKNILRDIKSEEVLSEKTFDELDRQVDCYQTQYLRCLREMFELHYLREISIAELALRNNTSEEFVIHLLQSAKQVLCSILQN